MVVEDAVAISELKMVESRQLAVRQVLKPWGRPVLPKPFVSSASRQKIGEIWFEPPQMVADLLIKYIFTSEKLSVQVHPSNRQLAGSVNAGRGKEECWLVIDAEPGASLGIGFGEDIHPDAMRRAALDGSIEELLVWHPVVAGDFFYIPANTVHAIGAGVSLIEVQQNSDITYRLFDYGRPRDLHLDDAVAVAKGERYDPRHRRNVPVYTEAALVEGPFFRLAQFHGPLSSTLASSYWAGGPFLVAPRSEGVSVCGEAIPVGGCGLVLHPDEMRIWPDTSGLIAQVVAVQ